MNRVLVGCNENKNIEISNEVFHTCGNIFELDESNIFTYETVDYFSETVRNYYTICPNCGHIILINESNLTKELKNIALEKSEDDPLLYKKNILRAQLIYLESITPEAKIRAKINW